jgi:hypothetical protein
MWHELRITSDNSGLSLVRLLGVVRAKLPGALISVGNVSGSIVRSSNVSLDLLTYKTWKWDELINSVTDVLQFDWGDFLIVALNHEELVLQSLRSGDLCEAINSSLLAIRAIDSGFWSVLVKDRDLLSCFGHEHAVVASGSLVELVREQG